MASTIRAAGAAENDFKFSDRMPAKPTPGKTTNKSTDHAAPHSSTYEARWVLVPIFGLAICLAIVGSLL